jgi:hypothetical protein
MEPHSEDVYGANPLETSAGSTSGEAAAIGGADLAPYSNETVSSTLLIVRPATSYALTLLPDSSDEDAVRDTEQLLSIDFTPQYAAIKAESQVLAAISTVTDARTRLSREQLEAELTSMDLEVRDLAETVLSGSSRVAHPTDIYERESRLRYWLISADGTRRLFSEWVVFFQARSDYLAWAPFDVQDTMESLHLASAEVQQRALEVTFDQSPSAAESDYVPEIRARLDPRMDQPREPSNGTYYKDGAHSRKRARWSQGRLNAWVKINGIQYCDLPDLAFDPYENELDSHCTPVSADIRLCNYPVSVEELLTVSL